MNDPQRLSEEASTQLELDLLRAGQEDAPPAGTQERVAIALGFMGGGAAGPSTATDATALKTASSAAAGKGVWFGVNAALLKALVVGLAASMVAIAATHSNTAPHPNAVLPPAPVESPSNRVNDEAPFPPSAPRLASVPVAETLGIPVSARSEGARPPAGGSRTPTPLPAPAMPRATPAPPLSIGDELALLDRAHTALGEGDAAKALRLVDEHDAKYSGDTFALESTVVRIDALDALGRKALALELAEHFLAAHPNDPMSRHVRSLAARIRDDKANP